MANKREYGVDLLRVICMTGIVGAHVLVAGQAYTMNPSATGSVLFLLQFFTHFTVNLFPIITGYFYSGRKTVKFANLIGLIVNLQAYALVITAVLFVFSTNFLVDFSSIFGSLFPVTTGAYWYFAAYVLVFLMIPWMNLLIRNVNHKQFSALLILGFVLFCIVPAWSKIDYFKMLEGYSPYWLIYCYFIGAYLRQYKDRHIGRLKKWVYPIVFLFNLAIALGIYLLAGNGMVTEAFLNQHTRFIAPISMVNVMCMMFFFMDLEVKNATAQKLLVSLSGAAFDVYMFHCHHYFYDIFIRGNFRFLQVLSPVMALAGYIVSVLGLYLFGWICCLIRKKIFKLIKIDDLVQWMGSKLDIFQAKVWNTAE